MENRQINADLAVIHIHKTSKTYWSLSMNNGNNVEFIRFKSEQLIFYVDYCYFDISIKTDRF